MTAAAKSRLSFSLEAIGLATVVAGFAALIYFFSVEGYLPPPFPFDTHDTFMDFFHTAYWSHNEGAYPVWKTIYLPLSFVLTGALTTPACYEHSAFDGRSCDVLGVAALLIAYVAAVIVSAIAFYRNDRSSGVLRTVAVALSGPLLFALERGNTILFAYIAFVLVYGNLLRSRAGIALATGFLINMKVYLLFPALMFAVKRRWRLLELTGLAALGIYLLTLAIVGAGTPFEIATNLENWFNYRAGTLWEEVLYSTTYKPYLLFDEHQYPVREFVDQRSVDLVKEIIKYEVIASRSIALLCILVAWFYPQAVSLQRLVFFVLMQSFIVQNPGGYAMTLVVFLVFLEKFRNWATGIAIISAYLVCIPNDTTVALITEVDRTSWLGNRIVSVDYELPLGALVRPGLLLIMLWSLAIDTLLTVHRAVKSGRPSVGLAPRHAPAATPDGVPA